MAVVLVVSVAGNRKSELVFFFSFFYAPAYQIYKYTHIVLPELPEPEDMYLTLHRICIYAVSFWREVEIVSKGRTKKEDQSRCFPSQRRQTVRDRSVEEAAEEEPCGEDN